MRGDAWKLRPKELYIACDGMDFSWYPGEVELICQMYVEGKRLADMSERVNRDPDEVAILIMDLARNGRIKPREARL